MSKFDKDVDEGVAKQMAKTDAVMSKAGARHGKLYHESFGKETGKLVDDVGHDLDNIGKETERLAARAGRDAEKLGRKVRQESSKAGHDITGVFQAMWMGIKNIPGFIVTGFQQATKIIGNFIDKVTFGLGGIGEGIVSLGEDATSIWQLVAALAALAIGAAALVAIVNALVAIVIGLLTAADNLLGVLVLIAPAFAGLIAVAVVLGPLLMSISQALSGIADTGKKWQTDLKNMNPDLRGFATTLHDIFGWLQKLGVRDILKPLEKTFTSISKALGPTLRASLPLVAKALGDVAVTVAKVFGNRKTASDFATIISTIGQSIALWAAPLAKLLQAILDFTASPTVMNFLLLATNETIKLVNKFSEWLNGESKGTKLSNFLSFTKQTLSDIGGILGAVMGFFKNLITPATENAAHTVLKDVEKLITKISNFLASKKGQEFINTMLTDLQFILKVLEKIGPIFVDLTIWAGRLDHKIKGIYDSAKKLYGMFKKVVSVVMTLLGLTSSKGLASGLGKIGNAHTDRPSGEHHFADGGIVNKPTFGLFGEDGPEVNIPLGKPAKARALAEASGLATMIRKDDTKVFVKVDLDGRPFKAMITTAINDEADDLVGARG